MQDAHLRHIPARQQGASLIIALLMLCVILLLGISAARLTMIGTQASRNDRDRQVAFQAAEAALVDAQMDLEGSRKKHVFPKDGKVGFASGCTQEGDYAGLCMATGTDAPPVWEQVDFLQDKPSVPYGRFTGRTFPYGSGPLPARLPRYIIEVLPYVRPGQAMESTIYRITAVGFGMRETTQVMLQAIYRKETNPNDEAE